MPGPMSRAKGQGTVVPIAPSPTGAKRWRIAVTMADGRRVWRTAGSPREAERIRAQLVAARELDLDPTRQTVEGFLRSWIDGLRRSKQRRVKATTVDHYVSILERLVIPELGALKLASHVLASRIQSWTDGLDAAPASVRHYHSILRHALERAVAERLIAWNPASVTELPRPDRHVAARPLSLDEARRLIETTADDRLGALWRLALVTGMRSGELLGLTWDAVGDGWVEVRAQLQRTPSSRGGDAHGWALTPTKVARTVDRVHIDQGTVDALEAHRRRMASERKPDWSYHGLVFVNERGMPYPRARLLILFKDACRRAGIAPRRVHDMRHTNLRLLNDMGVSEDVRMARAGHQTKQMARAYGGASDVQDRHAAEALARVIGGHE